MAIAGTRPPLSGGRAGNTHGSAQEALGALSPAHVRGTVDATTGVSGLGHCLTKAYQKAKAIPKVSFDLPKDLERFIEYLEEVHDWTQAKRAETPLAIRKLRRGSSICVGTCI
jgi:hypothetical protein